MLSLTRQALTLGGQHRCCLGFTEDFIRKLTLAFLTRGLPWSPREALAHWPKDGVQGVAGGLTLGHLDWDRRLLYLSRPHPLTLLQHSMSLFLSQRYTLKQLLEARYESLHQWRTQRALEKQGWSFIYSVFNCPREYGCANASSDSIQDFLERERQSDGARLGRMLRGEPLFILKREETLIVYEDSVLDSKGCEVWWPGLSELCLALLLGEASAILKECA